MACSSGRVRQHHADGPLVAVVYVGGAAQLALRLRRLLGEDVALERLAALDRAAGADLEPLGGRFLRLHLWHSNAPVDYPAVAGFASSFFSCFAGFASLGALGAFSAPGFALSAAAAFFGP